MKKPFLVLGLLSIFFLVVYLWAATPLPSGTATGQRFDWPDETANYFWTLKYAQTGQFVVAEPLNQLADNQIHPRSFNVRPDGSLVPGSFLGLAILYGTLAKLFSSAAVIYFTPVISILAVWAFYFILKEFFDPRIALLSASLMFFHPAWWYYSVTTLLPNVAFVALLLFSFYFLLHHRSAKVQPYSLLLAGVFAGLALSIRPAEVVWIMAVYLALFYYLKARLNYKQIIIFLVVTLAVILPSLLHQQNLYGNYLSSGYAQLNEATPEACSSCSLVKAIIAPFGFHPSLVAKNFWIHFVSRMWWLSLLLILGLAAYIASPKVQSVKSFGFMLVSLFVFAWLTIYYGSWEFSDQLTVHLNTLGLSYVRYWLPLYLLSLPFMALGLIWLTTFLHQHWKNLVLVVLLLVLFSLSANLVLYEKPDSIIPVKQRIVEYKKHSAVVNSLTEDTAVIVTVRKDKLFFPDRKVIHTFEALSLNQSLQSSVASLVTVVPVYYYALGPEPTLELTTGLSLELVSQVGQEILYKVKKL